MVTACGPGSVVVAARMQVQITTSKTHRLQFLLNSRIFANSAAGRDRTSASSNRVASEKWGPARINRFSLQNEGITPKNAHICVLTAVRPGTNPPYHLRPSDRCWSCSSASGAVVGRVLSAFSRPHKAGNLEVTGFVPTCEKKTPTRWSSSVGDPLRASLVSLHIFGCCRLEGIACPREIMRFSQALSTITPSSAKLVKAEQAASMRSRMKDLFITL
jgi:hypothetical protein